VKKVLIALTAAFVVGAAALWFLFEDRIERATTVAALFTGAEQYANFNRLYEMFPSSRLEPAEEVFEFGEGERIPLPQSFSYEGRTFNTEEFLALTDTSALLVIHNGNVVFEDYWLTGGRDVQWLSMSVAKSFISALVGIAVEQGHIERIDEPITDYVPELAGSAYDSVSIKDILQMSSGASWDEDYSDPNSDINRFGRTFAIGGSMNEFATTLMREFEPGTYNRYNSTDTQVLGWLLVNATGQSITEYMQENLWTPLGAESPAYWLRDDEGMEMAFAGLNVTARDYAKLGEAFRLGGVLNGQQIVPTDWVLASVTPDAPHLMPGADNPASDFPLGYGLQWWVPESDEGEFTALGVYHQFIFVNPTRGTVVVKLSAYNDFANPEAEEPYLTFETIELLREITRELD